MPDQEKVIKELEEVQHYIKVENLPAHTLKAKLVIDDALALLKVQEPVKPIIETTYGTAECDDPWGRLIFCGACGKRINEKYNPDEDDKYCKHCGKPVKWG